MRIYDFRKRILVIGAAGFLSSGSRAKIDSMLHPMKDPEQRRPAISMASDKLGWQLHTPLERGLKKIIAYIEHLLRSGFEGVAMTPVRS